jgi:hypothetical protein
MQSNPRQVKPVQEPQMTVTRGDLADACDLALAGKWADAHGIVQRDEQERISCWIHAVLHRIEGDDGNARYWYGRCGQSITAYADPNDELRAIKAALTY